MSKITLDNLSDNLKAYLEGLGLSEEQVLNLINENGLNEEELKAMLKDTMSINELSTNSKTVIGAINELFQSANNGKELIANAIGEPLSSEDTFSAMSNDINGLLSTFKTNMMNNGVTVESSDRFKSLIDKIATLADSEGKGIQFTEGTFTITGNKSNYTVNMNLLFSPTYVFANIQNAIHISGAWSNGTVGYVSNLSKFGGDKDPIVMSNVSSESFTISVTSSDIWSNGFANGTYSWYAIGVGEEDTTLRDSLADILENKGVEVSPDDDMASLISKVDSIGGGSEAIIVTSSLPSTVVNGQIVLIPKVETNLPVVLANRSHMNLSTETEICVSTTEIANNFKFDSTINNIKLSYYLNNAMQYSGGKKTLVNGYVGVNGVWSQFSKTGIIFYLDGVDYEKISGASGNKDNDVYMVYNVSTSNKNGKLTVSVPSGSTLNAHVCFKKGYDLTQYSKLEIQYVKDSTLRPDFNFGFSKSYEAEDLSLVKSVRINDASPASGIVSLDVSSLRGVHYFTITGIGTVSEGFKVHISSIILS